MGPKKIFYSLEHMMENLVYERAICQFLALEARRSLLEALAPKPLPKEGEGPCIIACESSREEN